MNYRTAIDADISELSHSQEPIKIDQIISRSFMRPKSKLDKSMQSQSQFELLKL